MQTRGWSLMGLAGAALIALPGLAIAESAKLAEVRQEVSPGAAAAGGLSSESAQAVAVPADVVTGSTTQPAAVSPDPGPAGIASASPITPPTATESAPTAASDAAIQVEVPPPVFSLLDELKTRVAETGQNPVPAASRKDVESFYEARKGEPLWVGEFGFNKRAQALLRELGSANDYALESSAFKVQVPENDTRAELARAEYEMTATALLYANHARGGRTEPRRLSDAIDREPQLLPVPEVLKALAEGGDPAAVLQSFHPKHPQFERLRQKLLAHRAGETVLPSTTPGPATAAAAPGQQVAGRKAAPPRQPTPLSPALIERKLVTNMEMWRWMPELESYHIFANIPEFHFRIVRDGKVVHSERIIVGRQRHMTPIFSNAMDHLVFKPIWHVPDSIKWRDMQPQLMRSNDALSRQGFRVQLNGRDVDTASIDWGLADMRQFYIFQTPGQGNALGDIKFMFPNRHSVYMHDTPSRNLFNTTVRTHSAGCVRVRDPLKFAELLMAHDKGWGRTEIERLTRTGPENNEVRLAHPVPIHLAYFTAWVDDEGSLKSYSDVYGHEHRVQLGIEGKTHLIQRPPPERFGPTEEERARMAERRQQNQVGKKPKEIFARAFGNPLFNP